MAALALAAFAAGCLDHATIGELCPAGCEVGEQDPSCDCSMVRAGEGAEACEGSRCAADADASAHPPGSGSGTGNDEARCAPGAYPLTPRGATLVVAFDDASSLLPWWPALSEGFVHFVEDDGSRGMSVGLMHFADLCDPGSYLPPLVPIAPLPDNLAAIQAAVPSTASLTTSTVPVLGAALGYAKDWATAHPGTHASVLLISDASPGACDGLTGDYEAEAARLASEAFAGEPSIATYAVGGDGLDMIKAIATAGGTQAVTINPLSTSDEVLSALRGFRSAAGSCELALPPGVGLAADSKVLATLPDGTKRAFGIERGSSQCPDGGFYVQDESSPYPLRACPSTCAVIRSSGAMAASLSLSSGCEPAP